MRGVAIQDSVGINSVFLSVFPVPCSLFPVPCSLFPFNNMIQPRKQFAQHWLKSDKILEIGPGTGILTRRLLPLVKSLLAVEIDRD